MHILIVLALHIASDVCRHWKSACVWQRRMRLVSATNQPSPNNCISVHVHCLLRVVFISTRSRGTKYMSLPMHGQVSSTSRQLLQQQQQYMFRSRRLRLRLTPTRYLLTYYAVAHLLPYPRGKDSLRDGGGKEEKPDDQSRPPVAPRCRRVTGNSD